MGKFIIVLLASLALCWIGSSLIPGLFLLGFSVMGCHLTVNLLALVFFMYLGYKVVG